MNPQTLISFPLVERLGWTLLHSAWEGFVVLIAAMVALKLLSKSSAQVRYLTACAALLLMFALAIGSFVALRPDAPEPLRPQTRLPMPMTSEAPPVSAPVETAAPEILRLRSDAHTTAGPIYDAAPEAIAVTTVVRTSWPTVLQRTFEPVLPWLVVLWAAGAATMSLWHMGGWIAVQRLKSAAHPVSQELRDRVARLGVRLRIRQAVRVAQSNIARAPVVIGWFRPVILVPAAVLTGLTPAHLDALLAHELAHVRRYDYLVNLVQVLVESLMFYHPAVWWISRRIRLEREHCCDDIAVTICRRIDYVEALAGVAEINVRGTAMAAGGSGQHELLGRIGRLLGVTRPEGRRGGLLAGVLVMAAVAGLALWLMAPDRAAIAAEPATQPSTTQPTVFTLPEASVGNISGTVTWDDGTPIEGVVFDYIDHSKWPALKHWSAVTDSAGRYQVNGVPLAGVLKIETVPGRTRLYLPPDRPIKLELPGDRAEDFVIHRLLKIAGTLINETNGKPAADHRFFVEFEGGQPDGMNSGLVGAQVQSKADGAFQAVVPSGVPVAIRFPAYLSILPFSRQEEISWVAQNPTPEPVLLGKLTADKTGMVVRARLLPYTSFVGTLVDGEGQPISSATIWRKGGTVPGSFTNTSETGRFRLRVPTDRATTINAETEGKWGELNIAAGQTEGTFVLRDKVDTPCVVTLPDGTPARGLVLYYTLEGASRGRGGATTDDEGRCILKNIVPGATYRARWASQPNQDYASGETTFDLSTAKDGNPVRFSVKLYDKKTLKGKVVDEQGTPIEGAVITGGWRPAMDGKYPTTTSDGAFTLPPLASGVITLKISKEGYRTTLFETRADSADFTAVLAKPESKLHRRFVVVTSEGKPAADLPMSILMEDQPARALAVRTGPDGAIDVSDLTDLPCSLICDVPGYGITWTRFDAETAGTLRVVAAKPESRVQYVRVLNGPNSPAVGVPVYLLCGEPKLARQMLADFAKALPHTSDIPIPSWKTNEFGYACIDRIGGSASVAVVRADGSVVTPAEGRSLGIDVLEMSVAPAGSLIVRLVHSDGRPGTDLKEATLTVRPLDNDRNGSYSRGESMPISAAEKYKFTDRTPGKYGISVTFPDGRSFGERVELEPGQTVDIEVKVPGTALQPLVFPEIALKEGVDDDPRWKLPPGDLVFTPGGSDEAAAALVERMLQVSRPWLLPAGAKGRYVLRMTSIGNDQPYTIGPFEVPGTNATANRIGCVVDTPLHRMAGSPAYTGPGALLRGRMSASRVSNTAGGPVREASKTPYTVKMVGETRWNGFDLTAVDVTFETPVGSDIGLGGQNGSVFSGFNYRVAAARIVIEESEAVPILIQSDPVDAKGAILPGPMVWRLHHQFARVDEGLAPQMLEWSDARQWTNGQDFANQHQRQEFQVINGVWLFKSGSSWYGDPNYHDKSTRITHAELVDVEVQRAGN